MPNYVYEVAVTLIPNEKKNEKKEKKKRKEKKRREKKRKERMDRKKEKVTKGVPTCALFPQDSCV